MTKGTRHEMFRRMLAREAGAGADAAAIAEAARRQCQRVLQLWTPVIGSGGVAAIYARAVHVTQRQFPCLASIRASGDGDGAFNSLRSCLAQQDPETAADAAVAILVSMVDLLSSLVGEGLTSGLLHDAWPRDFSRDPSEERTT